MQEPIDYCEDCGRHDLHMTDGLCGMCSTRYITLGDDLDESQCNDTYAQIAQGAAQ